uniref:Cystathionine gamma-synthase n=1 Tax=Bionectria ochroleuca TaxID=29856 RepID=A0A0B7JW54_BIOOC
MAEKTTDELALRGAGPGTGKTPGATLTSLSSKVVHADDNISAHRAVAPAMHVSTTFRYDDDPDQLKMVLSRLTGLQQLPLDCDPSELGPGDVVHVETPLNPTGEARNLQHYADKAHKAGAYLTVDATFAPPPLQDPFAFGADVVMHSGTKYFGGHSDMLIGVEGLEDLKQDLQQGFEALQAAK